MELGGRTRFVTHRLISDADIEVVAGVVTTL
jgi:hypothetical protein